MQSATRGGVILLAGSFLFLVLAAQGYAESGESLFFEGRADYYGKMGKKHLDKALTAFEASCDKGYAIGCLWAGKMHADGEGTKPSAKKAKKAYNKALKSYSKQCDKGDVDACFEAAELLRKGVDESGHGVEADSEAVQVHVDKGLAHLRSQCDAKDLDVCERLARELDDKDPAEAAEVRAQRLGIILEACQAGDSFECMRASEMFAGGEGVEQDTLEADALAARATELDVQTCEQGDADVCQSLGHHYLRGKHGVEKDRERAMEFFQKACELGHKGGCREVEAQ